MSGRFIHRYLKESLLAVGIRVVNARKRWGVALSDDLLRFRPKAEWQTIFDVGANDGEFAAELARVFHHATVFAFEPYAASFRALEAVARRNPRIRPMRLALFDRPGSQKLRVFRDVRKNTFVPDLRDSMRVDESAVSCEVDTIDRICAAMGIGRIDLLKLDVEGAEGRVLAGADEMLGKAAINFIYAEFHAWGGERPHHTVHGHTTFMALNSQLTPRGFRPLATYTQSIHMHEPIGTYNALFGHESRQ